MTVSLGLGTKDTIRKPPLKEEYLACPESSRSRQGDRSLAGGHVDQCSGCPAGECAQTSPAGSRRREARVSAASADAAAAVPGLPACLPAGALQL